MKADDGYNRQNSGGGSGDDDSSDGGYSKQVKQVKQRKTNVDDNLLEDVNIRMGQSNDATQDATILQEIKK